MLTVSNLNSAVAITRFFGRLMPVCVALGLMSGCVFSDKPDQDTGFVEATSLADFAGCYQNCSHSTEGSATACLSREIWPGKFGRDDLPDAIQVTSPTSDEFVVFAYRHGRAVAQSTFVEGEHFVFRQGRIELKREYHASGASEPGNVFIGLGTGQTVLGLDAQGEGRVEQSVSVAGTAFLIIPVAGTATDVSKIKRVGASCQER